MNDRMTDERLLNYAGWVADETHEPGYFAPDMDDIKELLEALKAERKHIAELETFCERMVNAYPDWRDEFDAILSRPPS
jgi:hypothetical protein